MEKKNIASYIFLLGTGKSVDMSPFFNTLCKDETFTITARIRTHDCISFLLELNSQTHHCIKRFQAFIVREIDSSEKKVFACFVCEELTIGGGWYDETEVMKLKEDTLLFLENNNHSFVFN